MNKKSLSFNLLVCFGFVTSLNMFSAGLAFASNKVVVIPMSGDDLKPLKNIITVAKENGDFTNPVVAIESINDSSAQNPYLIVIAPGVYTLNKQMLIRPHIDVTGSGTGMTKLVGAAGSATMGSEAALIFSQGEGKTLSNLSVDLRTAEFEHNTAIYIDSSTFLDNISLILDGDKPSYGLVVDNAIVAASNISILSQAGSLGTGLFRVGIAVFDGQVSIDNSSIELLTSRSSIISQIGIMNSEARVSLSATEVTVFGGNNSHVVLNSNNDSATHISNSRLRTLNINGNNNVCFGAASGAGDSGSYVANSFLDGPVTGDPKCQFVFNTTAVTLDSECQLPNGGQ